MGCLRGHQPSDGPAELRRAGWHPHTPGTLARWPGRLVSDGMLGSLELPFSGHLWLPWSLPGVCSRVPGLPPWRLRALKVQSGSVQAFQRLGPILAQVPPYSPGEGESQGSPGLCRMTGSNHSPPPAPHLGSGLDAVSCPGLDPEALSLVLVSLSPCYCSVFWLLDLWRHSPGQQDSVSCRGISCLSGGHGILTSL